MDSKVNLINWKNLVKWKNKVKLIGLIFKTADVDHGSQELNQQTIEIQLRTEMKEQENKTSAP